MPSNEERREVAARLRSVAERGGPEWATSACCIAECLGEYDYPLWDSSEKLFSILADLIEPEERTCRMEYDKIKRGVYCSHCGERMDVYTWEHHVDGTAGYLYPFCYWCGAKVVE